MRFLRKLHKWLGLLVGVQVILWSVSGILFAWLDHDRISAEHDLRTVAPPVLAPALLASEPPVVFEDAVGREIYDIRLIAVADRWLWRVERADRVELRDLRNGEPLQLDASWVRSLALARYAGEGRLTSITLQAAPDVEARAKTPVWRAQFDDAQGTSLYFAAEDGRFIAARNASWRLYDFFWMLHTMDYKGRDDFNNPLVITMATAALWLSISGALLLLRSFRRADFGLPERRPAA